MEFLRIFAQSNIVSMEYEIILMLVLLVIPAVVFSSEKKLGLSWLAVSLFFVYIHRDLLGFLVSGIYFFVLSGLIWAAVRLDPKAFFAPAGYMKKRASCLLSPSSRIFGIVIILILLIQICRINIAIDYDSLRYGLRSDVLLSDHGIRGFFENMGLVNTVYTYPKGFELITLPLLLVSESSYSFALSFNIWVLIWVMLTAGEISAVLIDALSFEDEASHRAAAVTMAAVSLIPGITNMSITAKSDLLTLLLQLIFVYSVSRYLIRKEAFLTGLGTGALILSYAMKPTALFFSSVIGIAAAGFILLRKTKLKMNPMGMRALILSASFTALITLRTFLITGMPFTSIFTGIFEKLGWTLKYPFRASEAFSAGTLSVESVRSYLERLFRFFVSPIGEDMEHVYMAWGGLVFLFLLFAAFFMLRKTLLNVGFLSRLKELKSAETARDFEEEGAVSAAEFLYLILIATLLASLFSLCFLYQVDGNYFMLLYAAACVTGTLAFSVDFLASRTAGSGYKKDMKNGTGFGVILVSVCMIILTSVTGWSGACGFTDIDFVNKGYYNHLSEFGLKNPLGWDKHERIVAFAYEPECYKLAGRVESFVDIDGSGGNVYLTDTKLDIWKQYLSFADIDYIYADIYFLNDRTNSRRERANVLFRYLLEDSCFEEITLEENSTQFLYCRIDKDRMAVSWEEDMGPEREARTKEQQSFFESIAG